MQLGYVKSVPCRWRDEVCAPAAARAVRVFKSLRRHRRYPDPRNAILFTGVGLVSLKGRRTPPLNRECDAPDLWRV
jgi:hypothetical protein